MAELADAHGSGPCESNFMEVQVLLAAPLGASDISHAPIFLGVEINPQFYWGKIETLVYENKTSHDIIVNGLATALLKYQGGFKQC